VSRAHRLIIVWMAGALGTVVVYGARRLQIAEGAAGSADVRPASQSAADDPREAITKYLQARYDEVEYRDDGHTITGLAYVAAEAPLVEVQDAALRQFLPETRFFTTKLASPTLEYQEVSTLVSFRRTARGDDIRSCVAVNFAKPSSKFLSQFTGIPVPQWHSQRELVLALADLLARTVHRGSARFAAEPLDGVRAEIWDGRLHNRDIELIVAWNGRVDSVILSNGRSHDIDMVVTAGRLP
jgi:hypothetical protein